MFSDTPFWRLVWKEYRTQRPLWLVLLIATPLLQDLLLLVNWMDQDFRPLTMSDGLANGLMAIGFIASVVYLLGCCATMFSVEYETGVFDFQRVLPANQPRVFWAKVGFAFVSSLLLTAALWIVTRGVLVWYGPHGSTWFGTYGLLYMAEVFAWSIFASLLIRQPLWGVIAAIAWQSLMIQVVLPNLRGTRNDVFNLLNEDARFTMSRFVVLALLFVADVVLGWLWFEDRLRLPRWRFRWKPDFAPSYASDVELPPYIGQRQSGWSRLLWLGWRDGRWVVGALLAWSVVFVAREGASAIFFPTFIGSFVFGLGAFAPDQWSGRFRFYTERGCSPRTVWASRQVSCFAPTLVMTVVMFAVCSNDPHFSPSPHLPAADPDRAAFEWMAVVLGPALCYTAGQLAAMLFRSTVMAIAVGFALCVVGFMWGGVMTSWLAPTWWAVGSLPVIALFVTWLKANDWLEERRDRVARWRLALGLGVPIALLLATCATYRVVQIPVVQLPAEWDQTDNAEAKLSPAENETLELYRRAFADQVKAESKHFSDGETRRQAIQQAHPDWNGTEISNEAYKVGREQWLSEMAPVISLLAEAHSRPAVALEFLNHEPPRRAETSMQSDAWTGFSAVLAEHARHQLDHGNLEGAWQDFEIEWELLRRSHLGFTASSVDPIESYEERLREAIVEWGRQPNQSRDRILTAIRRLEIVAQQDVVRHEIHRQLVTAQSLVGDYGRWQESIIGTRSGRFGFWRAISWWMSWRMQPWERWRFERLLRRQVFFAVGQVDAWKRQLEAHQPLSLIAFSDVSFGPKSTERTLLHANMLPSNAQGLCQFAVFHQFVSRAEAFRATILRLALADWHREHGCFPESLSELAPLYFVEVPRDPQSAGPFVYFPHGVPEDVTNGREGRQNVRVVKKKVPFLVTSGGGTWRRSQLHDGSWAFTSHDGKRMDLSAVLRFARVWLIENDDAKSDW